MSIEIVSSIILYLVDERIFKLIFVLQHFELKNIHRIESTFYSNLIFTSQLENKVIN